ncbi:MAG TPA: hypothetical protein VGC15_09955 [Acetobacteraceae bacterium]
MGIPNATTIKPTMNTATLSDDIIHVSRQSWSFDPTTVQATVGHRRVHLIGTVRSQHDRQLAAGTAWA